ncbi:MAG: hypothetical protein JNK37_23550 [Verrucomicrobiales bacterium]|nr:hypothetical protein [Verrucomicrobiales bacterium]
MTRLNEISVGYLTPERPEAGAVVEAQLRSLVGVAMDFGVGLTDLSRMMGDALRSRLPLPLSDGYATPDEGLVALLTAEGGCVEVGQARLLFRKPGGVTRQALALQIRNGNVLAYRSGGGDYVVPVWQFRPEGGTWEGLPEVLKAIREQIDSSSPLAAFAFLLQAHPLTGGLPPLHYLREGRLAEVLAAVEADAR